MDLYDVSFLLSTLWVGPFWFAMLLNPEAAKTHKLMKGPWFFAGPIAVWFLIFIFFLEFFLFYFLVHGQFQDQSQSH